MGARFDKEGDEAGEEERAADHQIEGQLHRAVLLAGTAPDSDERVHRQDGDFVEEEEDEDVARDEDAEDAEDEERHEGEVLFDAQLEGPHREDAGEKDDGVEHHQDDADAVDADRVVDPEALDPGDVLGHLVAAERRIEAGPYGDGQDQPGQREERVGDLDGERVAARDEDRREQRADRAEE